MMPVVLLLVKSWSDLVVTAEPNMYLMTPVPVWSYALCTYLCLTSSVCTVAEQFVSGCGLNTLCAVHTFEVAPSCTCLAQ